VHRLKELKAAQQAFVEHVRNAVKNSPRDGSVNLQEVSDDPAARQRISTLRQECQQLADEKVLIAQRAYDMVESHSVKLGM
jgi:hypothetical protein